MSLATELKEDFRRDVLGRLNAASIIGIRSDSLLTSLKKDSRYAQVELADLQAEIAKMATHGWVEAKTNQLAAGVSNFKITEKGKEFCYENGIE